MSDEAWFPRLVTPSAQALYLHLPFCVQKCSYCDFASWPTRSADPLMPAYRDALLSQLSEAESLGLLDGVGTAYIGGGTPTLLGEGLAPLVSRVASLGVSELTCEANPDSLSDATLAALAREGATRLSIGVQSLDDRELGLLGRVHDAACAADRVGAAVASGLDVSCDLMCATPGQTDASWESTLRETLALGPVHVSVYPLMIEEGTPFDRRYARRECPWNSEEVQAARMQIAEAVLEGSGFGRYEVASYARPGHRCHHNIAYWTGRPYLGLGTNASSMLTVKGYLRLCEVCPQLSPAPCAAERVRLTMTTDRARLAEMPALAAQSFSLEFLTGAQAAAEDLMLGARLAGGLDPGLVAHAGEVLAEGELRACLDGLLADGLLAEVDGRLAPTERGWLLGNELYERLWDLAPGEVASAEARA